MAVPDGSLVLLITTNSVPWNLSPPATGENASPVKHYLVGIDSDLRKVGEVSDNRSVGVLNATGGNDKAKPNS